MKDFEQTQFPGKDGSDINKPDEQKEVDEHLKKYFNREGPQETTIPAATFIVCHGCKYLSHQLIKSGMNPIYADNCEHPETEKKGNWFIGNLHKNFRGVIETPEWCPFLKPKQNETTKES